MGSYNETLTENSLNLLFRFILLERDRSNDVINFFISLYSMLAKDAQNYPRLIDHLIGLAGPEQTTFSEFKVHIQPLLPANYPDYSVWLDAVSQANGIVNYFETGSTTTLFQHLYNLKVVLNETGISKIKELNSILLICISFSKDDQELIKRIKEWTTIVDSKILDDSISDTLSVLTYYTYNHRFEKNLWSELLLPTIKIHKKYSKSLLSGFIQINNKLSVKSDWEIVKYIVGQKGVKSKSIVSDLLVAGTKKRYISDLTKEGAIIKAFIDKISFNSPELYFEYKEIEYSENISRSKKTVLQKQLLNRFNKLCYNIVSGKWDEEIQNDPNFGHALYFVFPPASSVNWHAYVEIVNYFNDYPHHTAQLPGGDELYVKSIPIGAYSLIEGEEIDFSVWEKTKEHLGISNDDSQQGGPDQTELTFQQNDLIQLGASLFGDWLNNLLAKEASKKKLLKQIYDHHLQFHDRLPNSLNDIPNLLRYKEFLADDVREIIISALEAYRETDPERYMRQATYKLLPPAIMGSGLIKSINITINAYHKNEFDKATLYHRLEPQLKRFDYKNKLDQMLESSAENRVRMLKDLSPIKQKINLGQEPHRIHRELVGQELAEMEKALYQGEGNRTKIMYTYNEVESNKLAFQLTKSKIHAPIGYCEGVCTATDSRLWDSPQFLQVIIWGEDKIAMGGIHILTSKIRNKNYIFLPGINPSLNLIKESGAAKVYETIVDFMRELCHKWNYAGIYIPTNQNISSNRGMINSVIISKKYPTKEIEGISFSYSPYRYNIDEVYIVYKNNNKCNKILLISLIFILFAIIVSLVIINNSMKINKTITLFSEVNACLKDENGNLGEGIRIVRSWKLKADSKKESDETITDRNGCFHFDAINKESISARFLPGTPVIKQEIVAYYLEKEIILWKSVKTTFANNGELAGRKIELSCRVDIEPNAEGGIWGTCVPTNPE